MSEQPTHINTGPRRKIAVIVAGGRGLRMDSKIPKQFLLLEGKPVLHHTVNTFLQAYPDIHIILVYPKNDLEQVHKMLEEFDRGRFTLAEGGDTRFASVKNGLHKITSPAVVFVHDGVRALVSADLIHRCYEQAIVKGSAVPALPLKESIRLVKDETNTAANREDYQTIQTPQVFLSEIILPAFDQPYDSSFTDEATVVEKSGVGVHLIPGEEQNIKITRPHDLWLASQLLQRKA